MLTSMLQRSYAFGAGNLSYRPRGQSVHSQNDSRPSDNGKLFQKIRWTESGDEAKNLGKNISDRSTLQYVRIVVAMEGHR